VRLSLRRGKEKTKERRKGGKTERQTNRVGRKNTGRIRAREKEKGIEKVDKEKR